MDTKEITVTAVARPGADLRNLAEHDGPLLVPCGTVGSSIARAVLSGGGQAEISLLNLKIATQTQDGVEGIFDNFQLYDTETRAPLFWSLVSARLKV